MLIKAKKVFPLIHKQALKRNFFKKKEGFTKDLFFYRTSSLTVCSFLEALRFDFSLISTLKAGFSFDTLFLFILGSRR